MIELLLEAERALAVGMLDQAERLYRQSADADPRNSIAVVGLARVALERNDEARALELGERALGIDPENLAARRLVDRLVEVRSHRGVPAPVAERPEEVRAPVEMPVPVEVPAPEPPAAPKPGLLRRLFRRR